MKTSFKTAQVASYFLLFLLTLCTPPDPLPDISANFTCNITSGTAPLRVSCACSATTSNISQYEWKIDGRSVSSGSALFSQTFDKGGRYSLSLSVTGQTGSSKKPETVTRTTTVEIVVTNPLAFLRIDRAEEDANNDPYDKRALYHFSGSYSNRLFAY